MTVKNIAVIGAGVLGLSVARSLARQGANVTVFERSQPGAGTSSTTFAWINANGKNPQSYHRLNALAIDEHVRLQQENTAQGRWLLQTGTFEWASGTAAEERLNARVNKLMALSYPVQSLTAEALKRAVPEIRIAADAGNMWYFPHECLLVPCVFMAGLVAELRAHKVTLQTDSDVTDVGENSAGATLRLADGNVWKGDSVVIATGRWSPELVARLGQPLAMIDANQPNKIACGFLATTQPVLTQLQSNLITPDLNVRPEGGGRLLLQAPDLDDYANPASPAAVDGFIGEEMLRRLRRLFDNMASARIDNIAVGQRSRPADGLPGLGYISSLRRVYLMVTHSGMTLAPLLGRLCADEIIQGARSPLLSDFSPQRLLGKTAEQFPAFATLHYPAAQ
ncbi:FAD-binding oxidoreductase [Superficieibacter sp. 1612_C1]|uniref:NAD(P)/FAD-dependent oxidoreductase n=1 Tax=Superficieibacter sp. 1612_C1 TaxID=2780382 RepID=UPI0018839569|nr:FAD-binding oxidoreductase [Superficieibacter sp. 1612_C1]